MDAVFVGIVVDVNNIGFEEGTGMHSERRFRVRVLGGWKGSLAETVVIGTGGGGGDCGYSFTLGDVYLIYAYGRLARRPEGREQDTLYTNICTRTRPWNSASEDSAQLGPPHVDRTNGAAIRSFIPGPRCSRHWDQVLRRMSARIVSSIPPGAIPQFEQARRQHFPHAGMLFHDPPARTAYGLVTYTIACAECQEEACRWWRKRGAHCSS